MTVLKYALLLQRPSEAGVRLQNKLAAWRDRDSPASTLQANGRDALNRDLEHVLGSPIDAFSRTDSLIALETHLSKGDVNLSAAPFQTYHNASTTLGRICYLTVRSIRPRLVMETGVAYGVTSAYILQALEDNGFGHLVSIDLPPLGRSSRQWVGSLVPDHLRPRWSLNIGSAQKLLPKLLHQESGLDVFVHDSLHTYEHMRWEFATVWKALQPGGVLIADDISGNRAFEECLQHGVDRWAALRQEEKDSMCGILRMPREGSARLATAR